MTEDELWILNDLNRCAELLNQGESGVMLIEASRMPNALSEIPPVLKKFADDKRALDPPELFITELGKDMTFDPKHGGIHETFYIRITRNHYHRHADEHIFKMEGWLADEN